MPCPYCNAELPPLSPPRAERAACPRCGEPVPASYFPTGETSVDEAAIPDRAQGDKRATLLAIVGVMAGMAIVAGIFVVMTQTIRREHDFRSPVKRNPVEERLAQSLTSPTSLLGLGYMPKDTAVVAGLHLHALSRDPAGKQLLAEPRPKLLDFALAPLAKAGIAADDVDHVVVGLDLSGPFPSLVGVAVTREPWDARKVIDAIGQNKLTKYRDGFLHRFGTQPVGTGKLWLTKSPRLLIFAWSLDGEGTADLDRVPTQPVTGLDHLAPLARQALTERVGKQSRVWAAGDMARAAPVLDLLALQMPKEESRRLGLVKAFGLGATFADDVTVVADLFTGEPKATQELRQQLESLDVAAKAKVEAPPPDVLDAEAQWVTWQLRADAETVRRWLETALPAGIRKR